jgi:hypothetical protein
VGDEDGLVHEGNDEAMYAGPGNNAGLSPAEALVLGRCHVSHRVSQNTVLFCFGSGRPSTNGLLAYNMDTDLFFRPRVSGPLPFPRFTCASTFLEEKGLIIFQGGFSSQAGDSINNVDVLDLAPALRHDLSSFVFDNNARSSATVGDEEARWHRRRMMERQRHPPQLDFSAVAFLRPLGGRVVVEQGGMRAAFDENFFEDDSDIEDDL